MPADKTSLAFGQRARPGKRKTRGQYPREKDPFSGGGLGAEMASVAFAQPTFRQEIHTNDSRTGIFLREFPHNFTGFIGRAIVHHNDFHLDSLLGLQVANRFYDPHLFVAGSDYHRAPNRGRAARVAITG